MNNKKSNNKTIFLIELLLSLLSFPIVINPQKLNIVEVRLNQQYVPWEGVSGIDTVLKMNTLMFHKGLIDHYGKDAYYDMLTNFRGKLDVTILNGNMIKKKLYGRHIHNNPNQQLVNSYFADTLAKIIANNYIFINWTPLNDSMPSIVTFPLSKLLYGSTEFSDTTFNSLSKDEFLDRQIQRIDSILTKTHFNYSRYGSERIFNTDDFPLFTDSITPMPPEYPSNLFN
ncbi:MAG: hypothetical protein HDS66_05115 [Bacteroidales bacterium]|nr:hypothetical protein [Bacteroidales bacterium]